MKFLLTAFLAFTLSVANSQKLKPTSTSELVMECTKTEEEGSSKHMSIWFPYSFWEIVGDQMKVSPEFVENIVSNMKDYMMFCVVDYSMSSSGLSFKTDAEIRQSIRLTDSSKNVYKPLNDNEISEDAKRLVKALQPTMAQMLGQFGSGMQIYLFKVKKTNGQPPFGLLSKNNFTLSWNTTSLNWKLPLASLLPPKYCPVDHEKMKGDWGFCPIHGVKLDQ